RANKLACGTVSTGEHLAATQFASAAGIDLKHVAYEASPMGDLAAGRIDLYVGTIGQGLADSRKGRARLLATMTAERTRLTPSAPCLAEENVAVPAAGLERVMLLAPAKTPSDVVARLAREVQAALGDKAVRTELERTSLVPGASSPGQLAREIEEARKTWAQFAREAGLSK
ncbi:MAG TPA: tripartite tricarboxylate transporter substrate-binding protein, partial [Usitatibacter sp.]|nr:tripartite tricarboxylate transporter substrate-binding protein [Usitatibacter sp.]